jgi:hypothetical protein
LIGWPGVKCISLATPARLPHRNRSVGASAYADQAIVSQPERIELMATIPSGLEPVGIRFEPFDMGPVRFNEHSDLNNSRE